MKKFRWLLALYLMILVFLISGCSHQSQEEIAPEKAKLVKVQEIKEDTLPVRLKYTGMTSSGEIKKYSFKVPGKLTEVNVEKGSLVHSGQKLASVSTTELSLAVQASELTVQKAEKAFLDAKDSYEKYQKLYEAGALPQGDLNKLKLDLDIKEASYNQAKIELQSNQIRMNDADLYADMDGVVVDVLFKKGEILSAGYPVIVVRAGEQKVSVGLSQNDVKKIKVGTTAHITVDGLKSQGEVTRIDAIPDTQSRTYNTEILLKEHFPNDKFYLGATTQVEFELGNTQGIWIPLASVLNDGEDYVYIIQGDRAVKKNIKLLNVQGFNVQVDGLESENQLVTMGMKALKEGTKVEIQAEGDSNA
jgi:RND family efflux transporter MFP subunit